MKLLKNVLIKLINEGSTDRVMIVDNIPEELFYSLQYPKMVKMINDNPSTQHWTSDTSKEKVMTLHEVLKVSQTGDGGICFDMGNTNVLDKYIAVDRYIKSHYPTTKELPRPIPNSTDVTNTASPVLALEKVPRVVLSVLSPSVNSDAGSTTADLVDQAVITEKIKIKAIEEYKEEVRTANKNKMAKAREAKIKTK